MVNELLPMIALVAVIFGVVLSVGKGYTNRPDGEKFKVGKLISSLIIGTLGSLSISLLTVQAVTEQINQLGWVAFVVMFIIQGFGTDQGLSKLDK